MVKLRFARAGGKKKPFYHLVATDSRNPRDGRFIEQIGIYDPTREPPVFRIDEPRVEHWLQKGARPSQTVGELLRRAKKAAQASA